MKAKVEEIEINGTTYVPKGAQQAPAEEWEGMPYKIVRARDAGVYAGYVENRTGDEVTLRNARRIWYWAGAASLSQLAMDGTSKPNSCKFPCAVDKVELLGVCEVIDCTQKAQNSIQGVPVWAQ